MKNVEELISKTRELVEKGLTTEEIANRLNVQLDTAAWLKMHAKKGTLVKAPPEPVDVYADWSQIGLSFIRVEYLGLMLADLAMENIEKGIFQEPDVIGGVDVDGGPIALIVARELGKPLALLRQQHVTEGEKCAETVIEESSFSEIKNKKVLLVDDVLTTGARIKIISDFAKERGAEIVGAVILIDKKGVENVAGVPVKSLIKILPLARS
ncbi:MAG: orotate phosphoribosyltransferase-like protein [Candidatus Odinarchaeum yellowstonii]|uniref:Orotate phosphoribosyltransferase-like protein n=1 Tax=Odinarchaeota yellowstonii (strain LCB_4) TaxID=1841599 RepID=A0AAF0IBW5_ODILC|nr:MAG: orotate phosphoribosyltransferase-like protein [Candidatus Odinarchaeum yellowstonii]